MTHTGQPAPLAPASPLVRFVRQWFLALLCLAYLAAMWIPGPGVWLRTATMGPADVPLSPVMMLLSVLMFNAGLALNGAKLRAPMADVLRSLLMGMTCRILAMSVGLLAGLVVVVWVVPGGVAGGIILGLLMMAVMPTAHSAVSWTQNAEGNVALCLMVVVLTTVLSPILSPFVVGMLGPVLPGVGNSVEPVAAALGLASLGAWLVVPLWLGGVASLVFRSLGLSRFTSAPKVTNWICLLLLNYANASVSLPNLRVGSGNELVPFAVMAATIACVIGYLTGVGLAMLHTRHPGQRTALIYSAGMSNGGYALTVAAVAVPTLPLVSVVIIVQTLMQHVLAGIVDRRMSVERLTSKQSMPRENGLGPRQSALLVPRHRLLLEQRTNRDTTATGNQSPVLPVSPPTRHGRPNTSIP